MSYLFLSCTENFNISLITLFAFMLFISNSKFIKAFISKQE
ncbi:hypothetical protein ACINNAV83_1829 [Acinetobacter baumannii Naval-83]|nr:hypothetical protein ACINNAV83_1829 [Acinetobacter baumannii Naval-83]